MADYYIINSVDATTGNVNLKVHLDNIGTKTMTIANLPLTSLTDLTAALNTMVTDYKAGMVVEAAPTVDATITAAVGVTQVLTA